MMDINNLLGRYVKFIPHFVKARDGSDNIGIAVPVKGMVDYINAGHGWFCVLWYAGHTRQHECFKVCDIGEAVTLIGRR